MRSLQLQGDEMGSGQLESIHTTMGRILTNPYTRLAGSRYTYNETQQER